MKLSQTVAATFAGAGLIAIAPPVAPRGPHAAADLRAHGRDGGLTPARPKGAALYSAQPNAYPLYT